MTENTNERELRDENTATDPIENNVDDQVLVDSPSKLSHEDTPATQAEIDNELVETRDGRDFEGAPTARDLHDQRAEEAAEADEER